MLFRGGSSEERERFIIKLQFSHRPWHNVKVKSFCVSCFGWIIRRRPISSRYNFTLPRPCLVLVRVGFAFYDRKFDHFFTSYSSLSMSRFFVAGLESRWTFHRVSHDTFMWAHIGKVFSYGHGRWAVSVWTSDRETFCVNCYSTAVLRHSGQCIAMACESTLKICIEMDIDECWWCCLKTQLIANVKQKNMRLLSNGSIVFNQGKSDSLPSGLHDIYHSTFAVISTALQQRKTFYLHEIRYDF